MTNWKDAFDALSVKVDDLVVKVDDLVVKVDDLVVKVAGSHDALAAQMDDLLEQVNRLRVSGNSNSAGKDSSGSGGGSNPPGLGSSASSSGVVAVLQHPPAPTPPLGLQPPPGPLAGYKPLIKISVFNFPCRFWYLFWISLLSLFAVRSALNQENPTCSLCLLGNSSTAACVPQL